MTTILPPFSGDRPSCAKCGHVGARVEWSHERKKCAAPKPNWYPGMEIGERLCRTCARCGYHWDEAVGDPGEAATGPLDHRAVADACRRLYNRWYWAWGRHGDAETPTGQRLLYELNKALIAEEPDSEDPAKGVPLSEFSWSVRIDGDHCRARVVHGPTGRSHVEEGKAADEQRLLYRAIDVLAEEIQGVRRG